MPKQYPSLEHLLVDLQPGDIVQHVERDPDLPGLNASDIVLFRPHPERPSDSSIIGFHRPAAPKSDADRVDPVIAE